jgi:hypothetical protein
MPTSYLPLWPTIVHLAWETRPRSIMDVGAGHGKGGLLLREYLEPIARLDAIEAEPRYLASFPWLRAIYDTVYEIDAMDADYAPYDTVLMIDVLEHLTHEQGEQLLRRIPGRVIICTPIVYFQNPEHTEYPTEDHRSVWTADEIAAIRPLEVRDLEAARKGAVLVRTAPL